MATMKAIATNVGPTIMCAEVRGHSLFTDLPEDKGGFDTAPLPPETLCGALANCIGMVIAITCREQGIEYAGMTVEVEAEADDAGNKLDNFEVTIAMPGELSEEDRSIVEQASTESKVRGTVMSGANVNVTVR
ncbi:MAG: OsmC family protein [candidate division WS1 bacterium]|nr:OsmC family protein [candidate division WS1 bacterium]